MDSAYAAWAARSRVPLGFLLGVAYLIFCRPTVKLLVAGGTVAAVGVAIRAFAAGHLKKNQELAMSGPYACTRNPLYLGSSLMGAGFAIAGGSWILAAACLILFAGIYWPVIRREEELLAPRVRRGLRSLCSACSSVPPAFSPDCGQREVSVEAIPEKPRVRSLTGLRWPDDLSGIPNLAPLNCAGLPLEGARRLINLCTHLIYAWWPHGFSCSCSPRLLREMRRTLPNLSLRARCSPTM